MQSLKLLLTIVFIFISTSAFAETVWVKNSAGTSASTSPSPYDNDNDITETLTVNGATTIKIRAKGKTERDYDFLYITDSAGNKRTFHGTFDETYTVSGSGITIRFTSDYSVTRSGVTVTISDASPPPPMGPFTKKYTTNLKGNLKVIGNTVLKFNGTIGGASNAELALRYVNIDSGGGRYNSSSATIAATEAGVDINNSRVKWAGLYWQGYLHNDTGDTGLDTVFNFPYDRSASTQIQNYIQNHTVQLKINNGSYNTISPDQLGIAQEYGRNSGNYISYKYSAFADVTSLLQNRSPNATYTVANIPTRSGRTGCTLDSNYQCTNNFGNRHDGLGNYGAWSLVVVYDNNTSDSEKTRNITVFDGYTVLSAANNPNQTINLSGFKTPKNAPNGVDSTLSVFAGEGDRNILGDFARLTNQNGDTFNLPDTSGAGSYFASVIEGVPNRNPVILNNNGIDIHTTQVGTSGGNDAGRIGTNQDSASITLGTTQDTFMPSMIAFATELYTPKLCYDYDVRIGKHIKIPSDNRLIETNKWGDLPLTLTLLIRSEISDFPIENTKLNVTFTPSTLSYIPNASKVSPPDVNIYHTIDDIDSSKGQIGIGRGSDAVLESTGGTIGALESTYIKQYFSFGNNTYYNGKFDLTVEGTIQFDPASQPVQYTLSTAAAAGSPNYIRRCAVNPVYDPIWANFNIEREDSNNYDPRTEPEMRYPLYTQIAGKPFTVSVVSYTKDAHGEYTQELDSNATVEMEVIDASVFENNSSLGFDSTCEEPGALGNGKFLNFAPSGTKRSRIDVRIPDDIPGFNNEYAKKSVAFRIWVLSVRDSNGTKHMVEHSCTLDGSTPGCFKNLYTDTIKAYDSNAVCQSRCEGSAATDQGCYACLKENFATPICSRDNFAIRPESFRIQLNDNNESNTTSQIALTNNNKSKYDPKISLAAGYKYAIDINATLFGDTGKAQAYYNENFKAESNISNLGSKTDNNMIAALEFKDKSACADTTHRTYGLKIQNGELNKNTYISHNNVGDYRFWMLDSNWTNVDRANYPFKARFGICRDGRLDPLCSDCDTVKPSSSSRNADGKLGCVINSNITSDNSSTNDRYIEIPLHFEPYSFGVNGVNFVRRPNRSVLFMNDFNKSGYYGSVLSSKLSMSASFEGNVTALEKGNSIVSNFTDGCAASDVRLNIGRTMTPSENSLTNVPLQQYLEVGLNIVDKQVGIDTNLTLPRRAFTDAGKGEAPMKLHTTLKKPFGFGKKINPIQVNYQELNATGDKAISSADMTTHIPAGNKVYDSNITYVYGKVTPLLRLYDNVEESYKYTPMFVDVFCGNDGVTPTLTADDCKNRYNLSVSSKGKEEKENGWRLATIFANNEVGTTDMKVSHLAEEYADPYISYDTYPKKKKITNVPFDDNNVSQNDINVSVAGSARNSMVKIKYDPVPWLIYDPKEDYYRVHFIGPSSWAGVGKTGHVSDTGSSRTQNNRMNW